MARPLNIRHDDILGRLDWIESVLGDVMPKSRRAENDAVGNPITGARTGEFRADEVTATGEGQRASGADSPSTPGEASGNVADAERKAPADEKDKAASSRGKAKDKE